MDYKVGDKVGIKSLEWIKNHCINEDGDNYTIEKCGCYFIKDMFQYCEKIYTVEYVDAELNCCTLKGLPYDWEDWIFENPLILKIERCLKL